MTFGALKQLTRTLDLRLGHYVGEFVTPGIGYMLKEAGCEYCFLDTEHSGMGFDVLNRTLRDIFGEDRQGELPDGDAALVDYLTKPSFEGGIGAVFYIERHLVSYPCAGDSDRGRAATP